MTADPTPEEVSTEAIDEMLNGVLLASIEGFIDAAANDLKDRAENLRELRGILADQIVQRDRQNRDDRAHIAELDAEIEAMDRAVALIESTKPVG